MNILPEDIFPARPEDFGRSTYGMRAWHGMTLFTLLRVMQGHWRHVSPSRYPVLATMLLNTFFNQLRQLAGLIVHEPRARNVRIAPDPVFVIGHWRSGTTWLHQTLLADPAFAAPTAQACFCPEAFLAGYETLRPLTARAFPTKRAMDNVAMGIDSAEEDEWAIALSGGPSAILNMMFPLNGVEDGILFFEDMTPVQRARWRKVWIAFLRRVQYLNPGRRLLLKSPGHTARIREILEIFPDARFVMIVRDPYRVIHSVRKSRLTLSSIESLQSRVVLGRTLDDAILTRFSRLFAAFIEARDAIPEGHIVTVRYEEFRQDVTGTIRHIYDALDLGDYDAVAPLYEARAAAAAGYETNTLSYDPDLIPRIDAACGPYFDAYGYPRMSAHGETLA